MMKRYEIVNIVENQNVMFAYDITVRHNETGECVVCDQVKVFDKDEYSLGYMFHCVKKGTWNDECMLNEEDEIALQKELGIENLDEYELMHEEENNEFQRKFFGINE